jgi:hypothetical protein
MLPRLPIAANAMKLTVSRYLHLDFERLMPGSIHHSGGRRHFSRSDPVVLTVNSLILDDDFGLMGIDRHIERVQSYIAFRRPRHHARSSTLSHLE